MTDMMDTYEASYAYEDFCQPMKCTFEASTARCVSIESDFCDDLPGLSRYVVTDGYSDVFDNYDIYSTILGTGSYSCVRECLHRHTGEKYAVKTIDKSKVDRLDHIQREIQLLRSIDHPGVMKMVDCYEDEDYVHIVTEKCTGGELFDKIVENTTEHGCMREDQAAKIIKSLLVAVDHLHSKDIVHRDIKPENILFETEEEGSSVKLIDFGLSRMHGLKDSPMTNLVGTSYYMSPGVLEGKYDRSCDLRAIGVVAYIMLCGYPPFNGSSEYEVYDAIRRGHLAFEKQIWGNLSRSSRDFVGKFLCKSSSKISTTAEALQHPWVVSA